MAISLESGHGIGILCLGGPLAFDGFLMGFCNVTDVNDYRRYDRKTVGSRRLDVISYDLIGDW